MMLFRVIERGRTAGASALMARVKALSRPERVRGAQSAYSGRSASKQFPATYGRSPRGTMPR
jgi:hypothetical protein